MNPTNSLLQEVSLLKLKIKQLEDEVERLIDENLQIKANLTADNSEEYLNDELLDSEEVLPKEPEEYVGPLGFIRRLFKCA